MALESRTTDFIGSTPGATGSASDCAEVKPGKQMSAVSRMSRSESVIFQTYDERIKGAGEKDEIVFPDNLEFHFEIPLEVEEIKVKKIKWI